MPRLTPTYSSPEERIVIDPVRWETYVELAEQRHGSIPRMFFDEGILEMMSPGRQHEGISHLIGRLVETYSEVHGIEIQSVASTTFQRSDLRKAFEADESYYVTHAERIRPQQEIDLDRDPPPDLVIEVEITSSAVRKMALFAVMGVPEVWRHDGTQLEMFRLSDGEYVLIPTSQELPGLNPVTIDYYLAQRYAVGETQLIRQFRQSLEPEAMENRS